MTPTEKQIAREKLLLQLYDASPAALALDTLLRNVQLVANARILDFEVERELAHLVSKGFAEETTTELSRGLKRWRITAPGTELLEELGLV